MAADPLNNGSPVLVGPDNVGLMLERVPLTPKGDGAFDEAWLQRLIHESPACLPIAEIEPSLDSFVAVCREMPTPRGSVDNLLMTGNGDIAIVEAKLFRNPEARRKVVAQALDYATYLFSVGYAEFERQALAGTFSFSPKPASLYDALPEAGKLIEAAFVDAVARNLRLGRVLILIVGDGIRSEAEGLIDGLQSHTRYGFTLALVELGIFQMPEADRFLVRPRTLARTTIVQRTVVEISGNGAEVKEQRLVVPQTIGIAAYWEALEARVPGAQTALEGLIQAAEPLGVYPDFLKSLNLRWDRPGAKSVNLGYIFKHASIWTDAVAWTAPRTLARAYVEDVAAALGCDVHTLPTSGNWTLFKYGKPLRLGTVLVNLDAWIAPMQRFIAAIRHHDAETE